MSAEKRHILALTTPLAALAVAAGFPAESNGAEEFGHAVIAADWTQLSAWITGALAPAAEFAQETYHSLRCALTGAGEAARSLWACAL